MDSPVLNEFLKDSFRIIDPAPQEVDWFYIDGDNVRSFTYLTNGQGWRESTYFANPTTPIEAQPAEAINEDLSLDGLRMHPVNPGSLVFLPPPSESQVEEAVHPGHENVFPDGLRMHPVPARRSPFLDLETTSNQEWDDLDTSEDGWAVFERWAVFESDFEEAMSLELSDSKAFPAQGLSPSASERDLVSEEAEAGSQLRRKRARLAGWIQGKMKKN